MVYYGGGFLKDEYGNSIFNADDNENEIGASGVESGLLNILFGKNHPKDAPSGIPGSNLPYTTFSDTEKITVQKIMTDSGILHSKDLPKDRMWIGVCEHAFYKNKTPPSSVRDLTAYNKGKVLVGITWSKENGLVYAALSDTEDRLAEAVEEANPAVAEEMDAF